MNSDPTHDTQRNRGLAIASLTIAYFTMGTALMAPIGLLTPMATQWQVNETDVALLLTVFSMTFALAAPTIQVVFSRFALRYLLLGGLGMLCAGSVGLALSGQYETGMTMRVVMAVGAAAIGPVATAIATAMTPEHQQMRTLAMLFSGITLSSVLGVPIAAWIGQQIGWQTVFWIIAVLAAACAASLFVTVRFNQPGRPLSAVDFLLVFRQPDTRWAVATTLLHMTGQFACYALIAPLFIQVYQLPAGMLSVALFGMGVGHLLSNILTGVFGDRFDSYAMVRMSLWSMVVIFALLWALPPHPIIVATLFLGWSIVGSIFQPPQQKRLISLRPELRPLLLAMNASALYLGIGAGTAIAGFSAQVAGLATLPLVAAIVTTVGILTIWLSRRVSTI